jgi:hypothetical protein
MESSCKHNKIWVSSVSQLGHKSSELYYNAKSSTVLCSKTYHKQNMRGPEHSSAEANFLCNQGVL